MSYRTRDGDVTAVSDVDLTVDRGRFVSVVGPTGCGKSTLLNAVAGLLAPEAGRVLIDGAPLRGLNRHAGYLFQQDALLPWRTVLDNVGFGLQLRGVAKRDRLGLARDWIKRVGLAGFEEAYPHQLSGGMRRRTALAQTWIGDPEMLLMDEPFGALDVQTRQLMENELLNLWTGSDKTVLFVTHDLDEAVSLSDEGGSVEVVSGFYDHTIQMQAKQRDVTSFVTMLRYPSMVLAVSPKASKPINAVADLAGANVGVTAPGSSTDFFLKYLLVRSGLAPEAAKVQGVGGASGALAAMEQGRVDAAVMTDPAFSLLAHRAGAENVTVLADTRTAQGVQEHFGVSTYPAAVLYTTREWLTNNGDNARKLASAIVKTLQWIEQHSAEEIADAMPPEYAEGNRQVYVESIARVKQAYSKDGAMQADGAEAVRAVLARFIPEVQQAEIDLAKTYSIDYLPGKSG